MAGEKAVLVLHMEGDVQTLKIENVSDSSFSHVMNSESGFHIYHVKMLTELILRCLQEEQIYVLSEEEIEAMALASCLHDIGKTQIPRSILDYPGKLSPVEYDIVKKHAVFGENIIRELDFGELNPLVKKYAGEIARWHHERCDGSGYPDGLKGEKIPLAAQVVSLADAFDALTSAQTYKEAFSQDVAIQMISSGMCGVFQEELVNSLLKVVSHSSLMTLREKFMKGRKVVLDAAGFVPKHVLCIGNTEYLTEEFLHETFPDSKVRVAGSSRLGTDNRLKPFKTDKPVIKDIFRTYEFDLIVYFSGDITYRTTEKNDAEELREVLKYAKELQKDAKIIFLSSLDSSFAEITDRAILSAAKERLCAFCAAESGMDIKVIQIPYLYSGTYQKDYLYKLFEKMQAQKEVIIHENPHDVMHFISLPDLSGLLVRLIDNWKSGSGILTIADDFGYRFADLRDAIAGLKPGVKVDFAESTASHRLEANNRALRSEYGWFARISVLEELAEEYGKYLQFKENKTKDSRNRLKKWFGEHSLFVKGVELVLLFLLTEVLVYITGSAVIFSIVDFRMAYIVIMATVHGLNFGLLAAALSSVSWLLAKMHSGTDLLTIFYEPTNWLAFVLFFLVGALCGYVRLHKEDQIRFVSEENKLLENKLIFLREIYEDTHQEKRNLKKQIIGSKDSFGKIFDIARKLDTVEQQLLYLRIMETFEDVLENRSITVYSINKNSTFGRLEVSSRDMVDTASRSVSVEKFAEVIETLQKGEIWRNTELKPDFPMYASGVYRGPELVLLIFLWNADIDQRSLYYVNLFKILCDLVQMSLLRAFDYNQAIYEQQYIEGTRIMKEEVFEECLKNYVALSEKKVSAYILLEIDKQGCSDQEMDRRISSKVRANDILGAAPGGKIRLLLSQATQKDLPYIQPRFEEFSVEVITIS